MRRGRPILQDVNVPGSTKASAPASEYVRREDDHRHPLPRAVDPSWEFYTQTILRFSLREPLEIDLREPLTAQAIARLASVFQGQPFAVISPCNPRGIRLSDAENLSRVASLHLELARAGLEFLVVDGMSPDRMHCEPGVAILSPMEKAAELGVRVEQSAVFWCDGTQFWLVPALVGAEACRLPFAPGL